MRLSFIIATVLAVAATNASAEPGSRAAPIGDFVAKEPRSLKPPPKLRECPPNISGNSESIEKRSNLDCVPNITGNTEAFVARDVEEVELERRGGRAIRTANAAGVSAHGIQRRGGSKIKKREVEEPALDRRGAPKKKKRDFEEPALERRGGRAIRSGEAAGISSQGLQRRGGGRKKSKRGVEEPELERRGGRGIRTGNASCYFVTGSSAQTVSRAVKNGRCPERLMARHWKEMEYKKVVVPVMCGIIIMSLLVKESTD
ncbi:hypothetical protein HDU97_002828 [Phlyctochytrium planicorne]|nr:hypothetical protein HDU97_002828 [Phlyctochytrium planicorne]